RQTPTRYKPCKVVELRIREFRCLPAVIKRGYLPLVVSYRMRVGGQKQKMQVQTADTRVAGLRRSLTLWDLILYGVIVIQPVAPVSVFGVVSDRGHGHVVTTILLAMIGMLFTAISYGRMARVYPSAGSAFTYVGQEINPVLGYVTGWSMVMDYM